MILQLRTKDDLEKIKSEGKSASWVISHWNEERIKKVEIYSFDGKAVLKGDFDRSKSTRNGKRLTVGLKGCNLVNGIEYNWIGQNPVRFINSHKGFFEFIAAADMERIHSQTLAWIISSHSKAFSKSRKNLLLCKLLGKPANSLHIVGVYTEIKNIDILVECEECFVVVENKLKSQQHSHQLIRYMLQTTCDENKRKELISNYISKMTDLQSINKLRNELPKIPLLGIIEKQDHKKEVIYLYLSFIGESESIENLWKQRSYKDVRDQLEAVTLQKEEHEEDVLQDVNILESYYGSLNNMVEALEQYKKEFKNKKKGLKDLNFGFVFTDGKFKKSDLIDANSEKWSPYRLYIHENQLITIFQKCFYYWIRSEVSALIGTENIQLNKDREIEVSETHGTGLICFELNDQILLSGNKFKCLLQFQGDAIKYAIEPIKQAITESGEPAKIKKIFEENISKNESKLRAKNIITIGKVEVSASKKEEGSKGFSAASLEKKYNWQIEEVDPVKFVIKRLHNAIEFFQLIKN